MIFRSIFSKTEDQSNVNMFSTFLNINRNDVEIIDQIIVDESISCKLDLVVKHYYRNYDMMDLFLKFNQITNPFEVPIGTILLIPDLNSLINATSTITYKEPENKSKFNSNKKTFNPRKSLIGRGVGYSSTSSSLKF